jgi:hypothetical protein
MDYDHWRNDIFGKPPGSNPGELELLRETYAVSSEETLDHIDRALVDPDIHTLFSKDQIGIGLELIYSNSCSDLPFRYIEAGDESRRIKGIGNLRYLYSNFFEEYCTSRVTNIGHDLTDGPIGSFCYMLWDIFVLYPGNASPAMVDAALDVMDHALKSANDNCIVSAMHGLGHWVFDTPQAALILQQWLRRPTTHHEDIHDYARQATTGCIL